MYYLNSRYYDAEVGRFINADDVNLIPLIQSGVKGSNLFEYCNNNAINMVDLDGESTIAIGLGISVVVAKGLLGIGAIYMLYKQYKSVSSQQKKIKRVNKS